MLDDFKMIVHKLPNDLDYINIYPISDLHLGSKECDTKLFDKWIETILNDPNAYCVIGGDMMNCGYKNSKSNVYDEVLNPQEQKDKLFELLKPIKHKILAGVTGNHEFRCDKEVGSNPLYDVFCRLQIEDVYRPNACFIKVSLGERKDKQRQITYTLVVAHGAGKAKRDKWCNSIDGADIFITGHTHIAEMQPPCKIRIDNKNNTVSTVEYTTIVCNSFQSYGGYALQGLYLPQASKRFQRITLNGKEKKVGFICD